MKIAIVVGHNAAAQGAVRVTDGVSEFAWNSRLAALIERHDPDNIAVFYRKAGRGYSAEIDAVYGATDKWGATCTIELHFNASVIPGAAGCLTLCSGSTASRRLATLLQVRMGAVMAGPDRGIEARGRADRGGRSLWQGRAPAALIEPYFGSNRGECLRADQHIDELAESIYRAAIEFHKGV